MSEINEIGSRFDRALSVLQVSNKEISELFDTSSQNVSNLKKADRLNDLMSRIAVKYNVNLNWLMSGEGDMFIQKNTNTQYVHSNSGNNTQSGNIHSASTPQKQVNDDEIDPAVFEVFKRVYKKANADEDRLDEFITYLLQFK